MDEAAPHETVGPQPAAGQIWDDSHWPGQPFVLRHCGDDGLWFANGAGRASGQHVNEAIFSRSACVGVTTPAGRVMVGERRRWAPDDATVLRVVDGDDRYAARVEVRLGNGNVETFGATTIAMLPLVAGPATERRDCPAGCERQAPGAHAADCWHAHPRAARERRRREIDRLLSGESTAMRCAALAALEDSDVNESDVLALPMFLDRMRAYESGRVRGMSVERAMLEMLLPGQCVDDGDRMIVAAYERARALP